MAAVERRSPPFDHPSVGRQLREAADRLGLSERMIARKSGVSRRSINLALRGANMTISTLVEMTPILEIDRVVISDPGRRENATASGVEPGDVQALLGSLVDAGQMVSEARKALQKLAAEAVRRGAAGRKGKRPSRA